MTLASPGIFHPNRSRDLTHSVKYELAENHGPQMMHPNYSDCPVTSEVDICGID